MERVDPGQAAKPATKKQLKMVERLLRDFPSSRELFEYADYQAAPTRGNASEFITRAIKDNFGVPIEAQRSGFDGERSRSEMSELSPSGGSEGYGAYGDDIANRPRVQKLGSHGLSTTDVGPLALSRVVDEVAHHPGVVWLPIISLRREDAARLGYDSAESWRKFLSARAMDMAKEIFQQDLIAVYQRQIQRRDELEKVPVSPPPTLCNREREEELRTCKGDLPERVPLSRQKEFRRVKNVVIEKAARLGKAAQADPSAPAKAKTPPPGLVFNTTAPLLYHMGHKPDGHEEQTMN